MAIDFPAAPTIGDTFIANNVTYTWDGVKWEAGTNADLDLRYVNKGGDVMTGDLGVPNNLIDNPGVAKAWGKVNGGTLIAGFNIASTSKLGTGNYEVTFSTPMPSGDYSIQATTTGFSDERTAAYSAMSPNNFQVWRYNTSGAVIDGEISFTVFSD